MTYPETLNDDEFDALPDALSDDEFDSLPDAPGAPESNPIDGVPDYNMFAPGADGSMARNTGQENYLSRFSEGVGGVSDFVESVKSTPGKLFDAAKTVGRTITTSPFTVAGDYLKERSSDLFNNPPDATMMDKVSGGVSDAGILARRIRGDAIGIPASLTPFTDLAYRKALQATDPEAFEATTPEEDGARFRDGAVMGGLPVAALSKFGGQSAAGGVANSVSRAGRFFNGKLGNKTIPAIPATLDRIEAGPTFRGPRQEVVPGNTYAENKTPELVKITETPRVEKSFNEALSNSDIERSKNYSRKLNAAGTAAPHRLQSAINEIAADPGSNILALPAAESEVAMLSQKKALGERIGKEIELAENARQKLPITPEGLPAKGAIDFTKTEEYVNKLPVGSTERIAADEFFATQKAQFESWDGDLVDLQSRKVKQDDFWTSAYKKNELTTNEQVQSQIAKKMASDMRSKLDTSVPNIVPLNRNLSNLHNVDAVVTRRAADAERISLPGNESVKKTTVTPGTFEPAISDFTIKTNPALGPLSSTARGPYTAVNPVAGTPKIPASSEPGPWANKVGRAVRALAPSLSRTPLVAPFVGSTAADISNAAGQVSGWIGKGGEIAGNAASRVGNAMPMIGMAQGSGMRQSGPQEAPGVPSLTAPQLLPRSTENLSQDAISQLMLNTAQSPQAPIAQALVQKLMKSQRDGDMGTAEKLHSDLTRLFPDEFEPGQGVNGKIFYPDEQKKYMDLMMQLHRMGKVDSIQMAKQQNSFNNPEDGRMLPMDDLLSQQTVRGSQPNKMVNGSRRYPY